MYQYLEIRAESEILFVTLSREKSLNALTIGMIGELRHVLKENRNNKIKGIIITGKGDRAFAAGADIKELTRLNQEEIHTISREGHKTFQMIEEYHVPVIAAINGYALGGGFELALACHIRIAGEKARVGLPETTLGLIPGYGGTQRLTRIVGRAKAIEMICSGDHIKAEEALRLGLVSYVTEAGKEIEKATEVLLNITKNAPTSVPEVLKTTLLALRDKEAGLEYEQKAFSELLVSDNGREGTTAFTEKRPPNFK